MYRHNASLKGGTGNYSRSDTAGGMRRASNPSGRTNGGFIGDRRRSGTLASNKNKLSGIWPISGLLPAITTVDEGYYTYPPSYQQWNITSQSPTGHSGKWNVNVDLSACGTTTWPQGSYGGAPPATPPNQRGRSWTKVGHQGCCGWDFVIVTYYGSYTTITPDPVWNDNDVDYPVWDFFA